MQSRSQPRTVWMFVLRFAALIALSFAVLAGVTMARYDTSTDPAPISPEARPLTETALA